MPASTTALYPIRVGSNKKRIQQIVVYGRSFSATCTLSVYVSSGMGTGAEGLAALQLSGGTTATTLDVAADGTYAARTLTLNSPAAYHAGGETLFLSVVTPGGGNFDAISYAVIADVP